MARIAINDNLPLVGMIQSARYCPVEPSKKDPLKTMGPDIMLVGRWTEITLAGNVEKGDGAVYIRTSLEQQLIALGILRITSGIGEPVQYQVTSPGPIQVCRTKSGNDVNTTVTLAHGAPAPAAPPPPVHSPTPPAPSGPATPSPAPPQVANPAAARAPAEDEATREKNRRKNGLKDLLRTGDLHLACLMIADYNFRKVTGAAPAADQLQAGAASIMIRTEKMNIATYRGIAAHVGEVLTKVAAKGPVPPAPNGNGHTPRPAVQAALAETGLANAGKRADGFDEWPEALDDQQDDDLPF